MRRDVAKARSFASTHSIALCTDDALEIIQNPEVDIVYVATPPSSHLEYVLAAAAAGKHVLVEKPMGLGVAEDKRMIDACDRSGVELFVSYYRRFYPIIQHIKSLIEGGSLGCPVAAVVDFAQPPQAGRDWGWRLQRESSGGGLFVDTVSHRIDLLNFFFGQPASAYGIMSDASPNEGEELTTLIAQYETALATVTGDFVTGRQSDRLILHGTGGSLELNNIEGGNLCMTRNGDKENVTFDTVRPPHIGLIRHIETVLRGQDKNICSGRDALLTDWILDTAIRGRSSKPG
jgi:predicted dehydrogenase